MNIRIDEDNLKAGVLSLVIAVVEVLHELMCRQALRRMESGSVTDAQAERLGRALMEVEQVLARLKLEQGVEAAVADLRAGLDGLVERMLNLEEAGGLERAS